VHEYFIQQTLNRAKSNHKTLNLPVFIIHLVATVIKREKGFKLTIMDNQKVRRFTKEGEIVRVEPHDLQLINSEPFFKEAFQRVGCLVFCEKMKRGHPKVAKKFALNFSGTKTKVGALEFEVSKKYISIAT
jgi:hypothetical protein